MRRSAAREAYSDNLPYIWQILEEVHRVNLLRLPKADGWLPCPFFCKASILFNHARGFIRKGRAHRAHSAQHGAHSRGGVIQPTAAQAPLLVNDRLQAAIAAATGGSQEPPLTASPCLAPCAAESSGCARAAISCRPALRKSSAGVLSACAWRFANVRFWFVSRRQIRAS